jgi:hypothetical protein
MVIGHIHPATDLKNVISPIAQPLSYIISTMLPYYLFKKITEFFLSVTHVSGKTVKKIKEINKYK